MMALTRRTSLWDVLLLLLLLSCQMMHMQAFTVPLVSFGTSTTNHHQTTTTALGLFWNNNNNNNKKENELYTPAIDQLIGKTIVITGASSGLGLESAKRLSLGGANLVLICRTSKKGERAVQLVQEHLSLNGVTYENQSILYKVVDLDNLHSVRQAQHWNDIPSIDVLLNNAGIMAPPERQITVDGLERQFQSNHLGHFLLTNLLSPKFTNTARIITVSSEAHKIMAQSGLLFDYLYQAEPPNTYQPWKSYGQSKLCNIYFTLELQRRIDAHPHLQWTTATLHPGVVATDLGRYLFPSSNNNNKNPLSTLLWTGFFSKVLNTPAQGANTQVELCCIDTNFQTGRYYSNNGQVRPLDSFATNQASGKRLWQDSEALSGALFTLPPSSLSSSPGHNRPPNRMSTSNQAQQAGS